MKRILRMPGRKSPADCERWPQIPIAAVPRQLKDRVTKRKAKASFLSWSKTFSCLMCTSVKWK